MHAALSAAEFWGGSLPRTIGRTNDEMPNMDMELLNHEDISKTSVVPITVITPNRE